MDKIYVELKNCYGIQDLTEVFEFDDKKAYLLYAPNGTMKTSLSNTINDIHNGSISKDRLFPDRETIRIVKDAETNTDLDNEKVFVIDSYVEGYQSNEMSTLLVNETLKKKYDSIYVDIEKKTINLINSLKKMSGINKNFEETFFFDFGYTKETMHDCFEYIDEKYIVNYKDNYSGIKYSQLFNKDTDKILNDKTTVQLLESYILQYNNLLKNSPIFKTHFNHNNAIEVYKTLDKTGFFEAQHKVHIKSMELMDGKSFELAIENEKKKILSSPELTERFQKLDDLLAASITTKSLRDVLNSNQYIIPEFIDIQSFKKKLWVYYLKQNMELFNDIRKSYKIGKIEIEKIIQKARDESTEWNSVISQYNERFSNMPFKLDIKNKEDVILKNQVPTVAFNYHDRGEVKEIEQETLLECLSNGEKKALYLLNIIFEIEVMKRKGKDVFLIIDDIADSFDYRNKYAIIEYLKDIIDYSLFKPLILTHNFDFYRTVAGRLELKASSYFVIKSEEKIVLEHGQYFENVFLKWKSRVYNDNKIFLSAIAFIRNIQEYKNGSQDSIYLDLTSLLHYKPFVETGRKSTNEILNEDLIKWYREIWNTEGVFNQDITQKVYDLLFETAELIYSEQNPNEVIIENKIVLSIAIRILTENYMIKRIDDINIVKSIANSQTRKLKDLLTFDISIASERMVEEIIEKVLIMTSENIHINSFMYEPIIDMSLIELIDLYGQVRDKMIIN